MEDSLDRLDQDFQTWFAALPQDQRPAGLAQYMERLAVVAESGNCFYQLDPELGTFSFVFYRKLEDAQAAGLRHYREHMEIMGSPVGDLTYVKVAPEVTPDPVPDVWNITDSLHPDRHITMMQIVRCTLES